MVIPSVVILLTANFDIVPKTILPASLTLIAAQSMPIPPTMSKPKTNNNKTNNKKKNKGKKNKIPQPSSYLNKAAGKEPSENKPPPSSFPVNPKPAPSGEPFSSLSEITYGIDVIVRGNLRGKVTFSGSVHYARGDWVGVVLEEVRRSELCS